MTADHLYHSLIVVDVDAAVVHSGLRLLDSSKVTTALLHLSTARHTQRRPEWFGSFVGVLVLLLLSGDHLVGQRMRRGG